jgi:hypothetical protein
VDTAVHSDVGTRSRSVENSLHNSTLWA